MKQNTISNNNKSWTDPEKEVLKRIVKHTKRDGGTIKDGIEQAAYRFERTYGAVYAFYHSNIDEAFKEYVRNIKVTDPVPPVREARDTAMQDAFTRAGSYITPEFVDAGDMDEYHADQHPEQYHPPEDNDFVKQGIQNTIDLMKPDMRYNIPRLPPNASDDLVENTILANDIYRETRGAMLDAQRRQVAYGLAKYPEPLNADTWTIIETIDHIISETVDKLHYLTTLKHKLQQRTEEKA